MVWAKQLGRPHVGWLGAINIILSDLGEGGVRVQLQSSQHRPSLIVRVPLAASTAPQGVGGCMTGQWGSEAWAANAPGTRNRAPRASGAPTLSHPSLFSLHPLSLTPLRSRSPSHLAEAGEGGLSVVAGEGDGLKEAVLHLPRVPQGLGATATGLQRA